MRRFLIALAPLFGLMLLGGSATPAAAQSPPNRFFGTATVNGTRAAAGTEVTAFIGGTQCGSGSVRDDGRYVVDVEDESRVAGCGTPGATITFRVAGQQANQTGTYQQGFFTELNLTVGGGGAPRFQEAFLDIADPRPCMPAPCDAERNALWNGDADAWARRGITDPDARFGEIIVLRVQGGDPSVISNIARILGNPYLQITRLRFAGQEFVEITNLGGGDQDMGGWLVRSPANGAVARFDAGYVMNPAQSCRIYSNNLVANDSCGTSAFSSANTWPDDGGTVVLFFEALNLEGATRRYSADPSSQPPQPDLQGVP